MEEAEAGDRHRLSDATAPPPPGMLGGASPFKGAGKKLNAMMDDVLIQDPKSISWPGEVANNDADFGGYYLDGWVLPEKPEAYWQRGAINPKQIMLGSHSKDGTAALYDVVPKWNDSASEYQQSVASFNRWGHLYRQPRSGAQVAGEYPLRLYEGMPSVAWLQADSDRSVICPMHEIARQASAAGVAVYSFMFTMGDPTNQCPGQNTYMSSNGFTRTQVD